VGSSKTLKLDNLRLFPYSGWNIVSDYIKGMVLEASDDDITWDDILTADQTVHAGWNILKNDGQHSTDAYRFYRLSHTSQSQCRIAELEFNGYIYSTESTPTVTSNSIDVHFDDGLTSQTFPSAL